MSETTTPITSARPVVSDRAFRLGANPSRATTPSTCSRVPALTDCGAFSARETVALLTPASRATSAIVARRSGDAIGHVAAPAVHEPHRARDAERDDQEHQRADRVD